MRPTYADIDLGAVAHNVEEFARMVAPSQVCAVVKADAYGHGDVPVAETALLAGASMVAVALVEEGVRLREAGVAAPVLVLSEPRPDAAAEVAKWDLSPTVYTKKFIDALDATGAPMGVHLKVDTGMHRVGVPERAVSEVVESLRSSENLTLEALCTHFPVADEDPAFTNRQIERFAEVAQGIETPMTHLANTAGAVLFPDARADVCRIGLGIYGLHPCAETREHIQLRPAMRFVSQVTSKRRLPASARPSYGRVRELGSESTVVTVPVGYADGFARARSGPVLIGGRRYPLAGRVTMDQLVVDVGDDEVDVGDEVVLIGAQESEEITVDEWASDLETISYEVVCSIGPRVPRRYL